MLFELVADALKRSAGCTGLLHFLDENKAEQDFNNGGICYELDSCDGEQRWLEWAFGDRS